MTESFAELFEESVANTQLRPGEIVIGTVVGITNDMVIVNAGLKSEGVIPRNQFLNSFGELEVAIGDQVEVALDTVEDGFGATRLSREKAKRNRAWQILEKAFESEEVVTGRINGKVKGGFTVELGEIRAFLPGSLVDVRPVRDTTYLEKADLAEYVRRRLLLEGLPADRLPAHDTPYRGHDDLAERVAAGVANRAYPSFLIAALTAVELVRTGKVLMVRGEELT